jgi:hypothetical protein
MKKFFGLMTLFMSVNCFADTFLIEFINCSNGLPHCAEIYYNISKDTIFSRPMMEAVAAPELPKVQQDEVNAKRNQVMMPWENGRSFPLKVAGRIETGTRHSQLVITEVLINY